jgi:uncharacterized protein YbaP (TraB family)
MLLGLCGWPPAGVAQADCPAPVPGGAAPPARSTAAPRDSGFLWRIQKAGRTSYLYGTVHLGRPQWPAFGPLVRDALAQSDRVALELDVGDPGITQRLQALLTAQPAVKLPDDLAQRLAAQNKRMCVPERPAALRPEMQAAALLLQAARRNGLDAAYGIDGRIGAEARALGKEVLSLETPELQAGLLIGQDDAATQAWVRSALDDLESGRAVATLVRLTDIWYFSRLADLERYESWCKCIETVDQRALQQRLIDQRNAPLARRIDAIHAAGHRVFVAVGALHMIGPNGLPALLAQAGYAVERVPFATATAALP